MYPPQLPPSPFNEQNQANFSALGPRNRYLHRCRRRRFVPLAITSHPSAARSCGSVHGAFIRGYESLRYTCEESHDYAERCAIGEEDTGRVGRARIELTIGSGFASKGVPGLDRLAAGEGEGLFSAHGCVVVITPLATML